MQQKRSRDGSPFTDNEIQRKRVRSVSDGTKHMDWEASQPKDQIATLTDAQIEQVPPKNICYGALTDVKAEVTYIEISDGLIQPWTSFHTFDLQHQEGAYLLSKPDSTSFGLIDFRTALCLRRLQGFDGVFFRAVISSISFKKIPQKPTKKKIRIDITINIVGPEDSIDRVGDVLDKADAYLQHPVFLESGTKYLNPHYLYDGDIMSDLRHLIGPMPADERLQRMSQAVENILESLGEAHLPVVHTADPESIGNCRLIGTELKPHQIEGIRFILCREDSSLSQTIDSGFLQLVETSLVSRRLGACRGGIIADAMGLGKTLTMLTAIACSRQVARENLGPTLVVLPSRQILDVWDSEIHRRFQPGAMKSYHFHGYPRVKKKDALLGYDVVLTTYHTLAADSRRDRVLQDVNWLRVVLDEAHWIRNQSTQLFKAAQSLRAETRWCLTGTPIQNSLDDLRSLLKFLRFTPLCDKGLFEKHIIDPLRTDSETSLVNLQYLLRIICLRRGSSLLELPPLEMKTVPVALCAEEQAKYESILTDCQNEFDKLVCMDQKSKTCVLFATMMKLRRLCNHGTVPLIANSSRSAAVSPGREVPTSDGCQLCTINGSDTQAMLNELEGCQECGRLLNIDTIPNLGVVSEYNPVVSANLCPPDSDFGMLSLPTSEQFFPAGTQYLAEPGYSSKLSAVISNIKESSCSGSKSLAFTKWRSTLELLGEMFSNVGIKFLRIDGGTNAIDRSSIVNRFQEDASISVLIMTIDSCAVGLTLTNADKVHIIEPQWNPAIEEQAIARAYRMGQTKTVTVIRYITEKTVEQNIVALQARKSRLAKFSLSDTADGDLGGALEDMKFVLNPEF
ncbi:hypothetical protein TWF788_005967 [Orbilia oligospora]|uniref:Uncharacterized protein n=1 Tax=Orbilia oligospora TaxID=2813651 RepID=A0A7C8PX04_ORBOL|nr:hypothetical protein TWF788_005967 [Orbilia oligospora]